MIKLALAIALFPGAVFAADVYKCPNADGKIEYRDQPCVTGKKIETNFNSIDGKMSPALAAEVQEFNKRVNKRLQETNAARNRKIASDEAFERECQGYREAQSRQTPWLSSQSDVARQSAQVEIGIQEQRARDAGCR